MKTCHGHRNRAPQGPSTSRNTTSSGKAWTEQPARCAARCAPASRDGRHDEPAPPGHPGHQASRRQTFRGGKKITEKDITFFTRQLATMMKAGVPLLQSFDIVGRGHSNARFVGELLIDIKTEVETGSSLSQAFRKYPAHFDALFCNLVAAGEARACSTPSSTGWRPTRKRSSRSRARSSRALFYPISVIVVAFVVDRGDHDLRDPGVQGRVQELRRRPARRRR